MGKNAAPAAAPAAADPASAAAAPPAADQPAAAPAAADPASAAAAPPAADQPAAAPAAAERQPAIALVASVRGFYRGAMVHPGQTFMFDPNPGADGKAPPMPKWAAPKGQKAEKQPPADPKAVDTRPIAAIAAAKAKAGQLGGAS
jgi:hypothetical protein